jgi:3-deoxy-D-manno-octulosonic acid kinase
MVVANQLKITKQADSAILYDASLIAKPTLQLFDSDYHTNSDNQQNNSTLRASVASSNAGIGRARVVYFDHENIKMVLKHYYRGGLVASIVNDKYIGFDIEKTRAFKEFRLLVNMQQLGLPVPEAIAARVEKSPFYFRADLITREIENAQTLADVLMKQSVDTEIWNKIGVCIKSFHQHNVYHSDLNARNILLAGGLQGQGNVYLIDFDNSYFRAGSKSWKLANLARLKRSLLKFKKNVAIFNFSDTGWSALLDGYNGMTDFDT